jgi:hypothetical protein
MELAAALATATSSSLNLAATCAVLTIGYLADMPADESPRK